MNTEHAFIYVTQSPNNLEYMYKVGRTAGKLDSDGVPTRCMADGQSTKIFLLVKVKPESMRRIEVSVHHALHGSQHLNVYPVEREIYASKNSTVLINRVKSILSSNFKGDVIEYSLDGTHLLHSECDFKLTRIRKDVYRDITIKEVDYTFFPDIPHESRAFVYLVHPIHYRDTIFKFGTTNTHTLDRKDFPSAMQRTLQSKTSKLLCIAVPSNVVNEIKKQVEYEMNDQYVCGLDEEEDTINVDSILGKTVENLSLLIRNVINGFTPSGQYNYLVNTTVFSKNGGVPSRCEHGKIHAQCKKCVGSAICIHKRIRGFCKECNGSQICEHERQRYNCVQCKKNNSCIRQRLLARNKELKRYLQESRFKKTKFAS